MSIWKEIKKSINTDLTIPLNKQLQAMVCPQMEIVTTDTTWIVPESGMYKIIVIGAGGTGVGTYYSGVVYAVSGGSGGVGISVLNLIKGDTYTISFANGTAFAGDTVSITATDGTDATTRGAGTGGSCTGAQCNYPGKDGSKQYTTSNTKGLVTATGADVGVHIQGLSEQKEYVYHYQRDSEEVDVYDTIEYGGMSLLGYGASGAVIAPTAQGNDDVAIVPKGVRLQTMKGGCVMILPMIAQ